MAVVELATTNASFPLSNNTTYFLPPLARAISQTTAYTSPGNTASDLQLVIAGQVIANSNAIFLSNGTNTGSAAITVLDTGVVTSTTNTGIALDTGDNLLLNFGTVTALGNVAVFARQGLTSTIENHGAISYVGRDQTTFGHAISTGNTAEEVRVINSGTISTSREQPAILDDSNLGSFELRNTGTVSSNGNAVEVETVAATIWNDGILDGDVVLGPLADSLTTGGTILGDVALGNGADKLVMTGGAVIDGTISAGDGNDTLRGAASGDEIAGDAGDDVISGGGGSDTLDGGIGRDTLRGQAGDDEIETGGWTDVAYGGAGDDVITSSAGDDTLKGGSGDDSITGGTGDNVIKGGNGEDVLEGGDGFDNISGGAGDDSLDGGRFGDTLKGGGGNDTAIGGVGNDQIGGGTGNDTLTGGTGGDRFVFAPGWDVDRVTDFADGSDRLDLSAFNLANFADLTSSYSVQARSGAVLIDFGDGDMLFVEGLGIASFSGADVIF